MAKSFTAFAATAVVLSSGVDAFWRLPCQSRSGLGRIDPIVDRGAISGHVHAIHGGVNFGFNTTGEDLMNSHCTSCQVTQDHSAYWTPPLYFIDAATGKAEMVEEEGGMLAYYLLYPNPGEEIKAFPTGFQMVSGDMNRRNFTCKVPEPPKSDWTGYEVTQPALAQKALGFNCLNYFDPAKTEPSLYRHYLPDKKFMDENCLSGLRLELMFPSCWNGKDLDSPDHKSHVAFPDLVMTGTCPDDYPVRTPSLFFETIWRTDLFKDREGMFALSNGDPTGYGYHGDFMAAWDDGVLQNAVDTCTNPSGMVQDCPVFDLQTLDDQQQCHFDNPSVIASENNLFPFQGMSQKGLLGPNPIQYGPAPANANGSDSASVAPSASSAYYSLLSATSALDSLIPTFSQPIAVTTPTGIGGGGIPLADAPTFKSSNVNHFAAVTSPASVVSAAAETKAACWSTSTTIVGQDLWEVCIDREMRTVFASETPLPTPSEKDHKRHLHHHAARHAHI